MNLDTVQPPDNQKLIAQFAALCENQAQAYAGGDVHLHKAVDYLQDWADTRGLIEAIGQDAVQWEIAKAFLPYREEPA